MLGEKLRFRAGARSRHVTDTYLAIDPAYRGASRMLSFGQPLHGLTSIRSVLQLSRMRSIARKLQETSGYLP